MKIGITGGIGSGKSHLRRLLEQRGIQVYDCDQAAKRIIRTSPDIRTALVDLIGPNAYTPDGQLNKAVMAQFLLASEQNMQAIDKIVHPYVFQDFEESGMKWMESAIIYESGIYRLVDRVIVVTAPLELRIRRVMLRDNITREKVLEWIGRQMPQNEVVRRADYQIINDEQTPLIPQIDKIFNEINVS